MIWHLLRATARLVFFLGVGMAIGFILAELFAR
jgi:hypothetical protein